MAAGAPGSALCRRLLAGVRPGRATHRRDSPRNAGRVGVGTYAPHDPSTADIADLVGSVDLSKVSEFGDEGDPRAWSWSGAVFAASRGMLEMIEILKVKREFLYVLLTLTQEKNVKVSRFPLIHLDETIIAHTNLAEFRKFLQEPENEALLDRMVIIQVPYTLSYNEEARIYRKLTSSTQAFREVHLDPHALDAGPRRLIGRCRIVEVHRLDDLEIIEGADHRGGDAHGRKPGEVRPHGGVEDQEFRPEAEQWRHSGKAEHEDRHRQRSQLVLRHFAVERAVDDIANFLLRELAAITLLLDQKVEGRLDETTRRNVSFTGHE